MSTRVLITFLCLPTLLGTLSFPLAASASKARPAKHVARSSSAIIDCSVQDKKAAPPGAASKPASRAAALNFFAAAGDAEGHCWQAMPETQGSDQGPEAADTAEASGPKAPLTSDKR